MTDQATLGVYGRKAAEYLAVTQDAVAKDPLLKAFIAALPDQSTVLDLGAGPGLFAAAIAAAGHRVIATDAVPEMVTLAAQHPGVEARLATFADIGGVDEFDGIWANFSLLHAPREKMPDHLAALKTALKPGGLFHIGMKTGTGTHRDTLGRLYTYYTGEELEALLVAAGFTVTDRTTGRDPGLDGTMADWIALRAYG